MNDNPGKLSMDLAPTLLECPAPGRIISPLGWSLKGRLLCAVTASTFLWLAVAWAIGWL